MPCLQLTNDNNNIVILYMRIINTKNRDTISEQKDYVIFMLHSIVTNTSMVSYFDLVTYCVGY